MKIIKLVCALMISAWASSANATLIFDFSFGAPGSEVTGEIIGLEDIPGIQAATQVNFTSSVGSFPHINITSFPTANMFTVDAGSITFVNFFLAAAPDPCTIDQYSLTTSSNVFTGLVVPVDICAPSPSPRFSGDVSFSARSTNPVPAPATLSLLLAGALCMVALRRRRSAL